MLAAALAMVRFGGLQEAPQPAPGTPVVSSASDASDASAPTFDSAVIEATFASDQEAEDEAALRRGAAE